MISLAQTPPPNEASLTSACGGGFNAKVPFNFSSSAIAESAEDARDGSPAPGIDGDLDASILGSNKSGSFAGLAPWLVGLNKSGSLGGVEI